MERDKTDTPEGTEGLCTLPSIENIRDWFDTEYWHQKYADTPEVRAILALLKKVDEMETEKVATTAQLGLLQDSLKDAVSKLELSNAEARTYLVGLTIDDADTD